VRRRILWKYRLKRIRAGVAAACCAWIVLWIGWGPGMIGPAVVLGIGLFTGFAGALAVRVSALDAAAWADARWQLKDLLATAVSLASDDPWAASVKRMADDRCAELRGSPIAMKFLGTRANGLVLLAIALVLTLDLFPGVSTQSWQRASAAAAAQGINSQPRDNSNVPPPAAIDRPAADGAIDEPSQRNGEIASPAELPGSGSGLARTPAQNADQPPISVAASPGSSSSQGVLAGGGNATASAGRPGDVTGIAADPNHAVPAPSWQTQSWPAADAETGQTIRNNQIDPAYQDLVTDYFQRP
jgi:hypothetical protein